MKKSEPNGIKNQNRIIKRMDIFTMLFASFACGNNANPVVQYNNANSPGIPIRPIPIKLQSFMLKGNLYMAMIIGKIIGTAIIIIVSNQRVNHSLRGDTGKIRIMRAVVVSLSKRIIITLMMNNQLMMTCTNKLLVNASEDTSYPRQHADSKIVSKIITTNSDLLLRNRNTKSLCKKQENGLSDIFFQIPGSLRAKLERF